jgi:hypothetical protein
MSTVAACPLRHAPDDSGDFFVGGTPPASRARLSAMAGGSPEKSGAGFAVVRRVTGGAGGVAGAAVWIGADAA